MYLFFHLIIFIVVLLMYIHIVNQCKTSEDLEIYELDYTDNEYLQTVCDIKQPSVFSYQTVNPAFFDRINYELIENRNVYDVKVKDIDDYWNEFDNIDYIVMPLSSCIALMKTDTNGKFISEDNDNFIEESGITDLFQSNDSFLKPQYAVSSKYDILTGSENSYMPFRFHKNLRYFVSVQTGKVRIKLTPWKSTKYLYMHNDYDLYEFRSPINIWKPQRKYFHEMDKMKFLEFDLHQGQILYIPPYWWYSIKFLDNDNLLSAFTYDSVISHISTIKDKGLYFLQQSNTKNKITRTIDTTKLMDDSKNENNDTNNEDENNDTQNNQSENEMVDSVQSI